MAMVFSSRARLLALCATLALLPLRAAFADPAIKPALVGLISTGSANNSLHQISTFQESTGSPEINRRGIFGGLVVQARWADLEKTGSSDSDFNTGVIDTALADVAKYNAAKKLAAPNDRMLGVRLRVFAGCSSGNSDAPPWALALDGGPITITAEYNNKPETCTVGRFWDPTSQYAAAWTQLQTRLANAYDANPLIQEVAVTSCTSFSAEPFFLNLKPAVYDSMYPPPPTLPPSPTATLQMQSVHYSDDAYRQCLAQAVTTDYAQWKTTRLEYSFNPFSGVQSPQDDPAFSERVMRACREAIGARCILSNHDLDAQTPSGILPIYALERKFGPNITFQALHEVPNDFEGTIRKGISLGAGSIEIWQEPIAGSFEHQSNETLETWAAMFEPQ
jgi:hypothetical protein